MPLPRPELGLVVRYGFVWAGTGRDRPPPDAGKSRPCLIVDLEPLAEGTRRVLRVTYLPISHVPPREGEAALAVPPRVAQQLGLTWGPIGETSWIYLSYAVEDDWPFDLAPLPGQPGRFDHGFVPPRLFALVVEGFTQRQARDPGLVHRRGD